MTIFGELSLIFGVCLIGECISQLLPFAFPAGVISLILMLALLMTGVVKQRQIEKTAGFFISNMGIVFVPSCVGILNYFDVLKPYLVPFFLIVAMTVLPVFGVTAWTVQLMMRRGRKGRGNDGDG